MTDTKDRLDDYIEDRMTKRKDRTFNYSYEELRKIADVDVEWEVMRIEHDLARQPAVMDLVTQEAAKKNGIFLRLKVDVKIAEAQARDRCRRNALASGGKATDKAAEEAAELDPTHNELRYKLVDAQEEYEKWKGLTVAFEQRAESLRGINALLQKNIIAQQRFSHFEETNASAGNGSTGKYTELASTASGAKIS